MRADAGQVDDWARRWGISPPTRGEVVQRLHEQAVVPPFTGMSARSVQELQGLSLTALGELRDLFRPDLYPPPYPPAVRR